MNKTATRLAAIGGLMGTFLVTAPTAAFTKAPTAMQERSYVAQFCAPLEQDVDAPRFYCRDQG